ncbi:HNH endonuclease [Streptomyces sp. NPDC054855]
MVSAVRYRSGGDNAVLKLCLHRVYRTCCYLCGEPKDFPDVEIDHILPKSLSGPDMAREIKSYGLPRDFDVQGPENLAPICRECNGRKSNRTFNGARKVLLYLGKAADLRSRVITEVEKFGAGTRLSNHLLKAVEADLTQKKAREVFETYAPAIVQKLARLDERKADYVSFGEVDLPVDDDRVPELIQQVGMVLRGSDRTAVTILQDVCGGSLPDLLVPCMAEMVGLMRARTHSDFEHLMDPSPTTSGPVELDYIEVQINGVDYHRVGTALEFTFQGMFDAYLSASLVQDTLDGGSIRDRQGQAIVTGTFSFTADWGFSATPGELEPSECAIESWRTTLEVS